MPADTPPDNLPQEVEEAAEIPLAATPVPASTPEIWTLRDLFFFLAFAAVWLLLSPALAYVGYLALRPLMGWSASPRDLANNAFFAVISQTIFYGPLLGYIYLLVVVRYGQPFWRGLAWQKPRPRQALAYLLGGTLLALGVLFAPSLLPESESFPLERLFSSPAAGYAIGGFAILVAPFMEEVIFRGVLFAIFERQAGLRFAVLVTAALFGAIHIPEYWQAWNHVLMILLVGVAFSLARGMTGSLAPSVILHVGYNVGVMAGLFFSTQHFRTLQVLVAISWHGVRLT